MDHTAHSTYRLHTGNRFGLLSRVLSAQALWRQRRSLATLDDHILNDIGLTRGQAFAESIRPVWDAPGHWRQ